jgi:hypothetical protein
VPDEPVGPSMAAFGANDSCPNCGARMAADQRYCLNCGHRRGDPRLPFMDAVVLMESMSAPGGAAGTPPPPPSQPKSSTRMYANAALIAGVATLVLAIGVGFLIGRAGNDSGSNAAAEAPIKVIEVGGGGGGGNGGESTETASTAGESNEATAGTGKSKGGKESGGDKKKSKASPETEKNAEVGDHGASKATEEVLHTEGDVKLAEPEQKIGGSCEKGAAGCGDTGEFTGEFFGE